MSAAYTFNSKIQNIFLGIFFSIGALFCLYGLISYSSAIGDSNRAMSWPTAEGVVVSSKAALCRKGSHFPQVIYRYSVNGAEMVGRRIAFGNCGCGSDTNIIAKFPTNSAVTVYYNPLNPTESVLMVGKVLSGTWVGICIMSALLIGSLFFLYKCVAGNYELSKQNITNGKSV